MLNRSLAPVSQPIGDLNLVRPDSMKYGNGLQTFVFHADNLDLIKFEFVFENVYEVDKLPLYNVVLASMLKEGTSTRSSARIADEIDFYGAYLMPEYSFDHTSLTLYTIRKYVDKVLPIVADILMDSIIPQQELDTYIQNNKQSLQIALQKNDVLARRLFYQNTFGHNQYGAVANIEDYDCIEREGLLALYQSQIRSENCTLFIAGRVDEEVLQIVRELFGNNWQSRNTLIYYKPVVLEEAQGRMIVETKKEALQSAIRTGYLTINRAHKDFPALQFVNTLLGGFFGSRLMRNIREEKGYTYSIGSAIVSLKHTGFMTLGSEVGVEVTKATMLEIEREFKRLREDETSQDEIDLVRNYMQGSLLGSLESIFSHVDKFKAVYFSGLDLAYYQYYNEVLRNIDTQTVQDIAARYFDFDALIKVIVGKY